MVKNQAVAEDPGRLYEELELSNRALEAAREQVQATLDELERTNAALRATNDELETMAAELRSAQKELQAISDELRLRTAERDEVRNFLESLVLSRRGALAVVDRDLRVSVWNEQSVDLWGFRRDDVLGQHLLNMDFGLPVEALRAPIRAVLDGEAPGRVLVLEATNRRGRELR
ncbi:MAG TPA: PAS domain-containing protein, partial [Acidimicrobiia bacterium]|nr:PAS domain-containing protein [Acidimicrobiia bacterium]